MLAEHLYWHFGNINAPEWAIDYLEAPVCDWTPEEIDFIDWLFNTAEVLKERASLMELHKGLTYEYEAARREPWSGRSAIVSNGSRMINPKAWSVKSRTAMGLKYDLEIAPNSETSRPSRQS